jgi:hypothetical protein
MREHARCEHVTGLEYKDPPQRRRPLVQTAKLPEDTPANDITGDLWATSATIDIIEHTKRPNRVARLSKCGRVLE